MQTRRTSRLRRLAEAMPRPWGLPMWGPCTIWPGAADGNTHHMCDDSWPPLFTSHGSLYIQQCPKIVTADSWRDPRSTNHMSAKCPEDQPNSFSNNLWLPSELPQVSPRTSKDCQKLFKLLQRVANICMNTPWKSMNYLWIIHRCMNHSWIIHRCLWTIQG